ncbi:jg5609, partial [Pararge aegeria aegeria]
MDNMEAGTSSNIENTMQDIFGVDEEDPYQDSGSEYLPSRSPSPTPLDLIDILEDNHSQNNQDPQNDQEQRKPRKRVRQPHKWKKNIRKAKRARGEEYVNAKGKTVPSKNINTDIPCRCGLKCHDKVGAAQQKALFDRFYAMESFTLQSSYLFSLVKVLPKKRCSFLTDRRQTESRRSNTRVYTIPNSDGLYTTVCKEFFKKVFAVSDGRISRVLKTKLSIPTPPIDRRGKHVPVNKTSEEKVQKVKTFIDKFPKYESHYTLHKSMNRRFLAPDLSLPKMYSMYCDNISESEKVSDFMFRKIFNEQFNLSFHAPVSDSCKKCDNLKIKIDAAHSLEEKYQLELQKKLHLSKADSAKDNYKKDKNLAK